MFCVSQSDSYKYPVTVETNGETGKKEKSTFSAFFKRLSQTEATQLFETENLTFEDLMSAVLVGWGTDLVGSDKQPLEFNAMNRDALFNIPEARFALREAFWESIKLGKVKN